ncbi:MAG TPA: PDZ domain-containing protein [Thermoanaerobaculia bacterium]|nr:PDZ domain-containing protein [Thermoanaerobaculia bacterium]
MSLLVVPMLLAADGVPGWIGIGYLYRKTGPEGWMLIQHVMPDGPAAKGGLRPRDIVTRIDGKPITVASQYDVMQLLRTVRPGREVAFTVRRGDLPVVITAAKMNAQQERLWRETLDYERGRAKPR